jgi:hypothetical protein
MRKIKWVLWIWSKLLEKTCPKNEFITANILEITWTLQLFTFYTNYKLNTIKLKIPNNVQLGLVAERGKLS